MPDDAFNFLIYKMHHDKYTRFSVFLFEHLIYIIICFRKSEETKWAKIIYNNAILMHTSILKPDSSILIVIF